jgi:Domain of unknown function (DUF1707)
MRYRFDPVYPRYVRRSGPTPDDGIRASDAERTEVADRLSHHFADGRLDQVEFKARLDRAIGATTRGDLAGLFDDLPLLPDQAPPRRRRRLGSVLALVILVVLAVGWIVPMATAPMFRVPWILLLVLGLLAWRRLGRHHTHDGSAVELGRYDRGGRP